MKAVVQRVSNASVKVDTHLISEIKLGLLTFLGIEETDNKLSVELFLNKISKLRIFEDSSGKMNLSVLEVQGSHLIVSQFTLCADLSKGNRPGFSGAAKPEKAKELYLYAIDYSKLLGIPTYGGEFGADMQVGLINIGPATFLFN